MKMVLSGLVKALEIKNDLELLGTLVSTQLATYAIRTEILFIKMEDYCRTKKKAVNLANLNEPTLFVEKGKFFFILNQIQSINEIIIRNLLICYWEIMLIEK